MKINDNYIYWNIFRKHMSRMGLTPPKEFSSWSFGTLAGSGAAAKHLDLVGRMSISKLAARISLGLGHTGYLGMFGGAVITFNSISVTVYLSVVAGCFISAWMEYFEILGFKSEIKNIRFSKIEMLKIVENIQELKHININELLSMSMVRHTLAISGVRYG